MSMDADNNLDAMEMLSRSDVFLLLREESDGEHLRPEIFETSDGAFALAFQDERGLAGFSGTSDYAALPGRVLAGMLDQNDLGLCLDPEDRPRLISVEELRWFGEVLMDPPNVIDPLILTEVSAFVPEQGLVNALSARLEFLTGLASHIILASTSNSGAGPVVLVGVEGAKTGVQTAIGQSLHEAFLFSSPPLADAIVFLDEASKLAHELRYVGMVLDVPEAIQSAPNVPKAPGSDPQKPPILR